MSQNNSDKRNKKEPKFNIYWIYGLLIVAIIAMNFVAGQFQNGGKDFTWDRFEKAVRQGDVKELRVINESTALVTLTSEALKKETYSDANKSSFSSDVSHYHFTTGPIEVFSDDLKDLNEEIDSENRIKPVYETRTDCAHRPYNISMDFYHAQDEWWGWRTWRPNL